MNKAYLVTEGCYSDYTVKAVFSIKTLAEQYIYSQNGPGLVYEEGRELRIEERDLDPSVNNTTELKYRKAWVIHLSDSATTVGNCTEECFAFAEDNARSLKPKKLPRGTLYTSLVSSQHARKLAVEAVQSKLRMQLLKLEQSD